MKAPKRPSRRPRIAKVRLAERLAEMIEEATVDTYGESEQVTGWFTAIDENLAVPFETMVLGVPVTVERVDVDRDHQIGAVCRRGRSRQLLPILDLPLLSRPPDGARSGSRRTDSGARKDDRHWQEGARSRRLNMA